MSKPHLVFPPLTRWVLAWPDGNYVCHASIVERVERGVVLFGSRQAASDNARHLTPPRPTPVKVRVTIEVAK